MRRLRFDFWMLALGAACSIVCTGPSLGTDEGVPGSDTRPGASVLATLSRPDRVVRDERANPFSPDYQLDPRPLLGASLVRILRDDRALDFAVKAKIYPEAPSSMFVTLRGGGVSVYDVSVRDRPELRTRWDTSTDVEGQDRRGSLLVVVARSGALFTFDVSDPDEIRHLATLELDTDPTLIERIVAKVLEFFRRDPFVALHTKLYQAADGRLYALVTAPLSQKLLAVDVTDPERPTQVGALATDLQLIEGIYVHRDHAFVGGFGYTDAYHAIDVSNPRAMRSVSSLHDPAFRQLVSEMKPYHSDLLYAALWNDPGGLGVFDVEDPANFRPLGTLLRRELAYSNRVKVHDHLAFLPLEQKPGGFAAVDIARPRFPKLVAVVRGIRDVSRPYTLEVNRDHLYLFGSEEATMAVFHLERGEPKLAFGRWNFGPGDAERMGDGRVADEGQGVIRFLDAPSVGEGSTRAQTSGGRDGAIGFIEVSPSGDWKPHHGLVLEHGFDHTFYGLLPAYTLVWDILVPAASFERNGCSLHNLGPCNEIALYQLDRTNGTDANLFLKVGATRRSRNGFVGNLANPISSGGLGGYGEGVQPDAWHRVTLVVDLLRQKGQASIYVDGVLVHQVESIDYERFAAVAEGNPEATVPVRNGFLLFADDDGDMNAPVRIASLLFANRAYDSLEVASLGPPGPEGIHRPREPEAGQGDSDSSSTQLGRRAPVRGNP